MPVQKRKAEEEIPDAQVVAQFISSDGTACGPSLSLPVSSTPEQLNVLINQLLQQEEALPYSFKVEESEIVENIHKDIIKGLGKTTEHTLQIMYEPMAIFKVRTVTRCTASLDGHDEAILNVSFSPDGRMLASGSGDTTVRIWDLLAQVPKYTLKGHANWVQIVAWSPDCSMLASGSMDSTIRLWDPRKGTNLGEALRAHSQSITSIAWEPMQSNQNCNRFASASRDHTVKVWDAVQRKVLYTISGHTGPVTCVKWGGEGFIYSSSRDKTIKVWNATNGSLVRTLQGHAHWVNHLTLSSEFILRTGPFDHTDPKFSSKEEAFKAAKARYEQFKQTATEKLVSCSDDFTLFLWDPVASAKPVCRMTGHQQLVNHISFSPDGRYLASASFDKSVKLWDGKTGKFISTLRGHVGAVYQVCWSSDSRQILSGSKDSTLKVWDLRTRKMKMELPGHLDEVFSVDWSPGGDKVASGGKDKILKLWQS